jgi:hypothetical protein
MKRDSTFAEYMNRREEDKEPPLSNTNFVLKMVFNMIVFVAIFLFFILMILYFA